MRLPVVFLAVFISFGLFFVPEIQADHQGGDCQPRYNGYPNLNFHVFSGSHPEGWRTEEFIHATQPLHSRFRAWYGEVEIASPWKHQVDARWLREARVCPNSVYTLSGFLKTHDVVADRSKVAKAGASLRVNDCFENNRCLEQTNGLLGSHNWVHVSWSFNTGSRGSISFGPSLGTYAGMAQGIVWARDLDLRLN